MLTGRDFWHSCADEEEGIPSVCFSDGPHGLRVQAGEADNFGLERSLPATCFPTLAALASSRAGGWARRRPHSGSTCS